MALVPEMPELFFWLIRLIDMTAISQVVRLLFKMVSHERGNKMKTQARKSATIKNQAVQ